MKITYYGLLFITALSLAAWPACADEFKLKSGQVYSGKMIDSDNQSIYIETSTGVINVAKNDLAKLPDGINPPDNDLVLKPAWGKKTPSSEPTNTPSKSGNKTKDGKIYGMDLAKIQQEGAQAQADEMKEAFRKAEIMDAFHKAANSHNDDELRKKLQKNPLTGWAINWSVETAAKANLRKIQSAAGVFMSENDRLPKSMKDLISAQFLDEEFNGTVNDYKFSITSKQEECVIHAIPADPSTGLISFSLNFQTGKIQSEKN